VCDEAERESPETETDPVKINRLKEPLFLRLAKSSAFLANEPMEKREFQRRMARACGLSIVTIRDRYVDKYIGDFLRVIAIDGIEYLDLRRVSEK
jgi:hypothetical protein